jgi:hypothetical protein
MIISQVILISRDRLASYAKCAKVKQYIDITFGHDYKIVNVTHNPHNNHAHHLMSTFEHSGQASPISKGVTEIRVNSHFTREITDEGPYTATRGVVNES